MIERRRFHASSIKHLLRQLGEDYQLATCIQDLSLKGLLLWVDEPELDKTASSTWLSHSPIARLPSNSPQHLSCKTNVYCISKSTISISKALATPRRLVELNVGSDELLHRELEHLVDFSSTTLSSKRV